MYVVCMYVRCSGYVCEVWWVFVVGMYVCEV